ncbi:MAG: DUF2007 domain-containing protein [Candidatus Aminicenantes bacterium]|jgi:hypothetical protein
MTDKINNNANAKETRQDTRLKLVKKVWGPVEAEVIKSLLESHGISCVLKGLVVQSVHAFSVNGLGEIKIFVTEKDFDLARTLIESR